MGKLKFGLQANGIILPGQVIDNRAWRLAKVKLVGPNVKQAKVGDTVIFPGDRGLQDPTDSSARA